MWLIIGVDPGPTPGIVSRTFSQDQGRWLDDLAVFQCNADAAGFLVDALLCHKSIYDRALVACEEFVVRGRSGRSSTPEAGKATRDLIGRLQQVASANDAPLILRRASDVKPFCSDDRLRAAGLYDPTNGMRHARDAARHLLFAGMRDAGAPDPLRRKERSVT